MGAQQKYTPPPLPAKKSLRFPSKTALFRTGIPYVFIRKMRLGFHTRMSQEFSKMVSNWVIIYLQMGYIEVISHLLTIY